VRLELLVRAQVQFCVMGSRQRQLVSVGMRQLARSEAYILQFEADNLVKLCPIQNCIP
jgi:hypothetical protein